MVAGFNSSSGLTQPLMNVAVGGGLYSLGNGNTLITTAGKPDVFGWRRSGTVGNMWNSSGQQGSGTYGSAGAIDFNAGANQPVCLLADSNSTGGANEYCSGHVYIAMMWNSYLTDYDLKSMLRFPFQLLHSAATRLQTKTRKLDNVEFGANWISSP
jgi:allophanate hydrolase subunit 2